MAAAVEAVEAIGPDEAAPAPYLGETPGVRGDRDAVTDTLDAVAATEADESVALRIALMAGSGTPNDADFTAAEASADSLAAESELEEAKESIALRIALLADSDGFEEAERAAGELAAQDAASSARPSDGEFEAGEFEAGAGASADHEHSSEEDAEAEALREALAIVLGGEPDGAWVRPAPLPPASPAPLPPASPAPLPPARPAPLSPARPAPLSPAAHPPGADFPAGPVFPARSVSPVATTQPEAVPPKNIPWTSDEPSQESTIAPDREVSYEGDAHPEARRKKGLFGRFRGS
jgi:hypothetical protein